MKSDNQSFISGYGLIRIDMRCERMDVKIYTDGAARGNPDGPGGYGTVIQFIDGKGTLHEREFSQGYNKTTNNRMELMAAIVGLEALIKPCNVELYSDPVSCKGI